MKFEQWVANFMKRFGYPNARRRLSQYQETDGIDLDNTGSYAIQCKSGKKINIMKAYEEAQTSSQENMIPLLFFKYDQKKPMVVMSANDFEKYVKREQGQ